MSKLNVQVEADVTWLKPFCELRGKVKYRQKNSKEVLNQSRVMHETEAQFAIETTRKYPPNCSCDRSLVYVKEG